MNFLDLFKGRTKKIPSADKAREEAETRLLSRNFVTKEIQAAVRRGLYQTCVFGRISEEFTKELRGQGYEVSFEDGEQSPSTTISWK